MVLNMLRKIWTRLHRNLNTVCRLGVIEILDPGPLATFISRMKWIAGLTHAMFQRVVRLIKLMEQCFKCTRRRNPSLCILMSYVVLIQLKVLYRKIIIWLAATKFLEMYS